MKKYDVIQTLHNGGRLVIDNEHRKARVYRAGSDDPETARIDTAYSIAAHSSSTGFKLEHDGDITTVTKAPRRDGAYGVDACADLICFYRNTLHMDCADIAADLMHSEETQGAFFNKTMWTAFDEIFPEAPSSDIMWLYYGAARDDEEVHGTPEKTKEHAARLIRQHMEMDVQETQWKDAEPAAEPIAEPVAEPAPTAEERRTANKERREALYAGILADVRNGGYICDTGDGRPYLYTQDPADRDRYTVRRRVPLATMERIARENDVMQWREETGCIYVGVETRGRYVRHRNFSHCKNIADRLDDIANRRVYRCPECDEWITFPDGVGDFYKCPHCGETFDIADAPPVDMWDYFDDALDIEYRCNARREYKSVLLTVAWGGPSIYIDTHSEKVLLRWWTDRAEWDLSTEAATAIDEWAAEGWGCM